MKKIGKLDITKEAIKREKALRISEGWSVISQTNNVIEDKINEVIEALNTCQCRKDENKTT